eukprot:COSAG01_NODE_956_length_12480_cov_109.564090_7_plen_58_part_00
MEAPTIYRTQPRTFFQLAHIKQPVLLAHAPSLVVGLTVWMLPFSKSFPTPVWSVHVA